jgi:hypothetical protein
MIRRPDVLALQKTAAPSVTSGCFHVGLALFLCLTLLGSWGCGTGSNDCICCPSDKEPPAAPRGLYSVTGDEQVRLWWLANTESDLAGYDVWWSDAYDGTYEYITTVDVCSDCYWETFLDGGIANGVTCYYAVSAFDKRGNDSELSLEEVWDTPRPEGFDVTISNALDPGGYEHAGFDLSRPEDGAIPANDPNADFWYEYDEVTGLGLLVAGSDLFWPNDGSEIQGMGWTGDLDEIDFAPPNSGWSPTNTAETIEEHTYVFLTRAHNYAKIRLVAMSEHSMTFDWAFQTVPWNRQLMPPVEP